MPLDPALGLPLTPDARVADKLADVDRRLRVSERGGLSAARTHVRLGMNAAQPLNNVSITLVTWDFAADKFGGTLWVSGGLITIPVDGIYTIEAGLLFNNAAGDHDLFLTQYNNTGVRYAEDNGNVGVGAAYRQIIRTRFFAAGAQLGLYAFQNSGGASTMGGNSEQAGHLSITRLLG